MGSGREGGGGIFLDDKDEVSLFLWFKVALLFLGGNAGGSSMPLFLIKGLLIKRVLVFDAGW